MGRLLSRRFAASLMGRRVTALSRAMSGSAPLPVWRVKKGERNERTLAGRNNRSARGGGEADHN